MVPLELRIRAALLVRPFLFFIWVWSWARGLGVALEIGARGALIDRYLWWHANVTAMLDVMEAHASQGEYSIRTIRAALQQYYPEGHP